MTTLKYYWPGILWAFIILLLCSIPGNDIPNISLWDIDFLDKIAHLGIFSILSFLLYQAARKEGPSKVPHYKIAYIIFTCIVYAALTELYQHAFFDSRTADVYDFIANCIGVITGIIFAIRIFRK